MSNAHDAWSVIANPPDTSSCLTEQKNKARRNFNSPFVVFPSQLIILEDYADPFDAEQAGGTQATTEKVTTENDGYMEPYEAQKMMAGKCDDVLSHCWCPQLEYLSLCIHASVSPSLVRDDVYVRKLRFLFFFNRKQKDSALLSSLVLWRVAVLLYWLLKAMKLSLIRGWSNISILYIYFTVDAPILLWSVTVIFSKIIFGFSFGEYLLIPLNDLILKFFYYSFFGIIFIVLYCLFFHGYFIILK